MGRRSITTEVKSSLELGIGGGICELYRNK